MQCGGGLGAVVLEGAGLCGHYLPLIIPGTLGNFRDVNACAIGGGAEGIGAGGLYWYGWHVVIAVFDFKKP